MSDNVPPQAASSNNAAIVVAETDSEIDLDFGCSQWINSNGQHILEFDYRTGGEVWRVHKNDADPYPSRPHAHCIAGAARFKGCTLHLGSAQLFRGRTGLNRYLAPRQFESSWTSSGRNSLTSSSPFPSRLEPLRWELLRPLAFVDTSGRAQI